MRHFLSVLLASLLLSAAQAASPVVDALKIEGKDEFPGLTVRQQRDLLALLRKSGPGTGSVSAWFMPRDAEELRWVNPELLSRLYYTNSPGSEANCYWTSMFAHGVAGLPERLMGLEEYESLARAAFDRHDPKTELKSGDVLRLRRKRGGVDTHSVIYVGDLRGAEYLRLVLTKNGPTDGSYLIMSLWDLTMYVYPSSDITDVYRLRR